MPVNDSVEVDEGQKGIDGQGPDPVTAVYGGPGKRWGFGVDHTDGPTLRQMGALSVGRPGVLDKPPSLSILSIIEEKSKGGPHHGYPKEVERCAFP